MRPLFTTDDCGLTTSALRWGERAGRWRRLACQVYGEGPSDPAPIDLARAKVLAHGRVARGHLAGVLHELDSVWLGRVGHRHAAVDAASVVTVGGIAVADGLRTVVDLAATLDDLAWEQALESALRKRLVTIDAIEALVPSLGDARIPGVRRIRRVLALRPLGAAPTESLLETLMVQLAREVPVVGELVRQHVVRDAHEIFVARLDLCRPDVGFFLELDGEHHKGQPVYDTIRETAVVATTGWLPGRFTWTEVTRHRQATKRRLDAICRQAIARHTAFRR